LQHKKCCAGRNTFVALVFTALSALELFLCWRALIGRQPFREYPNQTLTEMVGLVGGAWLYGVFKCRRERLVLSVVLFHVGFGIFARWAPDMISRALVPIRVLYVGLWALATALSISLLLDSVRKSDKKQD
jgi:hypothetical protein